MESYNTVLSEQIFEQTIQKSRFIGRIAPANTEAEAAEFLNGIRKLNRDASHNCFAYYLYQEQIKRFSDDGEPGSTAGLPIFDILIRNNVFNCIIVVTRYFGGTLLGTGGLVRAYGSTAQGVLDKSRIVTMKKSFMVTCTMDYSFLRTFEAYIATQPGMQIGNKHFTDKVTLELSCEYDQKEEMIHRIQDITGRSAAFLDEKTGFLPWES